MHTDRHLRPCRDANLRWALHGLTVALLLALASCAESSDDVQTGPGSDASPTDPSGTEAQVPFDAASPGPWAVGHRTLQARLPDERLLAVEAWYPAVPTDGEPTAIDAMEEEARGSAMAELLAEAPAGCLRERLGGLRGAPVAEGLFPVVLYSHCHVCTRWSGAAMAERLASHGVIVLAPDHEGNTLWDQLEDSAAPVGEAFLRVRADDLHGLLAILRGDADPAMGLLDGDAPPADLLASLDLTRVATMGHSFGAVTAGLVLQEDQALLGAFAVAAPMENPLIPGVRVSDLGDRPTGFLLAVEDNSITTFGNNFLRENADEASGGSVLVEVEDLGHWGMSDIVSLLPMFAAGCGEGRRMTNRRDFTYLPPDIGRDIAATAAAAFMVPLLTDADAGDAWEALDARDGVSISTQAGDRASHPPHR